MTKKTTITINSKVLQIIISSIIIGFLLTLIPNFFSKEWYYATEEGDYGYEWEQLSIDEQLKYFKKLKVTEYQFTSIFGSQIIKCGETGFIDKDFSATGGSYSFYSRCDWKPHLWGRGKFSNPIKTLIFQIRLTLKDWKYVLLFGFGIMFIRLFFWKFKFNLNSEE